MLGDSLVLNGYLFNTPEEYEEAKREDESVRYIKSKTNFKDYNVCLKLYNTLSERKSYHTVIGFDFMHDLYNHLKRMNPDTEAEPVKVIELKDSFVRKRKAVTENANAAKTKELSDYYTSKIKSQRIVIVFLLLTVIALFILSFVFGNNPLMSDEVKLQDKYSAWEEELKEKELELNSREKEIEIRESEAAET